MGTLSQLCSLPSGKLTYSYGKSQGFIGKFTISMAMFNGELLYYQSVVTSMCKPTQSDLTIV